MYLFLYFLSSCNYTSKDVDCFFVPFPSTKPHCSSSSSGLILFLIRIMMILYSIFVIWLIRLIILCNSHSVVPGFFGSTINTDMKNECSGTWPVPYRFRWVTAWACCFASFQLSYSCPDLIFHERWASKIALLYAAIPAVVFKKFTHVLCPSVEDSCLFQNDVTVFWHSVDEQVFFLEISSMFLFIVCSVL